MASRLTTCDEELEERIEITASLLGAGLLKSAVKAKMVEMWGCSTRTCETYISRARVLLMHLTQRPKEEHFTEAASFYTSVIQSEADLPAKLKARERLDSLYGLDAKFTAASSQAINVNVTQAVQVNGLTISIDEFRKLPADEQQRLLREAIRSSPSS